MMARPLWWRRLFSVKSPRCCGGYCGGLCCPRGDGLKQLLKRNWEKVMAREGMNALTGPMRVMETETISMKLHLELMQRLADENDRLRSAFVVQGSLLAGGSCGQRAVVVGKRLLDVAMPTENTAP